MKRFNFASVLSNRSPWVFVVSHQLIGNLPILSSPFSLVSDGNSSFLDLRFIQTFKGNRPREMTNTHTRRLRMATFWENNLKDESKRISSQKRHVHPLTLLSCFSCRSWEIIKRLYERDRLCDVRICTYLFFANKKITRGIGDINGSVLCPMIIATTLIDTAGDRLATAGWSRRPGRHSFLPFCLPIFETRCAFC